MISLAKCLVDRVKGLEGEKGLLVDEAGTAEEGFVLWRKGVVKGGLMMIISMMFWIVDSSNVDNYIHLTENVAIPRPGDGCKGKTNQFLEMYTRKRILWSFEAWQWQRPRQHGTCRRASQSFCLNLCPGPS